MSSRSLHSPTQHKNVQDYSALAADYDDIRFKTKRGRFLYEADRQVVRRLVTACKPQCVLDVPTGTGRVLDYLQNLNLDITGIDATEEMLNVARTVSSPGNRVTLQLGDASNLALPSNSVDCLVSLRFFHLFSKPERKPFATEFARVIKPGGFLLLSFTNGWYGFGYYWLRRFAGRRTVFFQYPGEIATLFPGFKQVALEGNVFPKQHWLANSRLLLPVSQSLNRHFPLNRLCMERFFLLQKLKEA